MLVLPENDTLRTHGSAPSDGVILTARFYLTDRAAPVEQLAPAERLRPELSREIPIPQEPPRSPAEPRWPDAPRHPGQRDGAVAAPGAAAAVPRELLPSVDRRPTSRMPLPAKALRIGRIPDNDLVLSDLDV